MLDAVLEGVFTPGEQLPSEAALAAQFNVSRLTMREAVRVLQAQGVIVQVPGSRHRIAPMDAWTGMEAVVRSARSAPRRARGSLELLEVRMIIETGAAQLAAVHRDDDDLAVLEECLAAMVAHHASGDVAAFVAADLAFHDRVLRAAQNRILVATLLPLTAMLAETRMETSAVAAIRAHAIDEHTKVAAAIREGSATAARDAMAAHMEQTRDDLVQFVHDGVQPRA